MRGPRKGQREQERPTDKKRKIETRREKERDLNMKGKRVGRIDRTLKGTERKRGR